MAVFGGPVGIGASIAIGAAMGAGANLVDQACSGYPIDWKQVGLSGALGALGGGIGAAFGGLIGPAASSALSRVGNSPIAQRLVQGAAGSAAGGDTGFITGGLGAMATGGSFMDGALQGARDGAVARPKPPQPTPTSAGDTVPDPLPQYESDGVTPNRGPAAWVNTMDEDGVRTHASSPGAHAEVNAQTAAPGAPMSRVWGWCGPMGAPVWREIPICGSCQSLFPSNVKADPGPWGLQ